MTFDNSIVDLILNTFIRGIINLKSVSINGICLNSDENSIGNNITNEYIAFKRWIKIKNPEHEPPKVKQFLSLLSNKGRNRDMRREQE